MRKNQTEAILSIIRTLSVDISESMRSMELKLQGPVVQSPISTNPGLTLNKTYGVKPGLALIGL